MPQSKMRIGQQEHIVLKLNTDPAPEVWSHPYKSLSGCTPPWE
jgi:hypothetical protein